MQQRQPRLGDILDDYCPRERRLTNHAVVAMINEDIRLTRCTTCEAEHDYKHAKVPRLRKKGDLAVGTSAGAPAPKRISHDVPTIIENIAISETKPASDHTHRASDEQPALAAQPPSSGEEAFDDHVGRPRVEEGPVHRQLIRAQLPRIDGQPPAPRQAPDFTIRQPTGRQNRFRPRQQHGGATFQGGQGNRSNGNGNANGNVAGNGRGPGPRPSGRPPMPSRSANRHGGRKRSK